MSSLPVPVSPSEEHGGLHRGHLLHLPQHRPEGGTLPHNAVDAGRLAALLGELFLETGVLPSEPVTIALDLPVELGISDRQASLVGEDAQEGELLGSNPAGGQKADRAELLTRNSRVYPAALLMPISRHICRVAGATPNRSN
jgi:hypothetical protein